MGVALSLFEYFLEINYFYLDLNLNLPLVVLNSQQNYYIYW